MYKHKQKMDINDNQLKKSLKYIYSSFSKWEYNAFKSLKSFPFTSVRGLHTVLSHMS